MAVNLSDWENSKENVLPLKEGRSASALSKAFSSGSTTPGAKNTALQEQQSNFERQLLDYEGDDPLELWLKYIGWIQSSFPSGKKQLLLQILERCTKEFQDSPQYKGDVRYLKLWILYADYCSDPKDVFQFLRAKEIGLYNALFWEAWAVVLEQKSMFPQANAAYQEGIDRKAQPLSRLRKHREQFLARMGQRAMQQAEEASKSNAVPVAVVPPGRAPSGGVDENNNRNVLGMLPNHHPLSASRASVLPSRGFPAPDGSARELPPESNIPVFVEPEFAEQHLSASADSNIPNPWDKRDFVYDSSAKKENIASTSRWTEFTIPQKAVRSTPLAPSAAVPVAVFDEFAGKRASVLAISSRESLAPAAMLRRESSQPAAILSSLVDGRVRISLKNGKERRERLMYDPVALYGSERELSFEEVRARDYEMRAQVEENDEMNMTAVFENTLSRIEETAQPSRAMQPATTTTATIETGQGRSSTSSHEVKSAAPPLRDRAALLSSLDSKNARDRSSLSSDVKSENTATLLDRRPSTGSRKLSSSTDDAFQGVTINTKKALDDVMAMFSSPLFDGGAAESDSKRANETTSKRVLQQMKLSNRDVLVAQMNDDDSTTNLLGSSGRHFDEDEHSDDEDDIVQLKCSNRSNSRLSDGFGEASRSSQADEFRPAARAAESFEVFVEPTADIQRVTQSNRARAVSNNSSSGFDVFVEPTVEIAEATRKSAARQASGDVDSKENAKHAYDTPASTRSGAGTARHLQSAMSVKQSSTPFGRFSLGQGRASLLDSTGSFDELSINIGDAAAKSAGRRYSEMPSRATRDDADDEQDDFIETLKSDENSNATIPVPKIGTTSTAQRISGWVAKPHGFRGLVDPFSDSHTEKLLQSLPKPIYAIKGVIERSDDMFPNPKILLDPKQNQGPLELEHCSLIVQRRIAKGGFSAIYEVDRVDEETGVDILADSTYALKVQRELDARWEFYIQRQLLERLPPRLRPHVSQFRMLELYSDLGFILMENVPHGSLQDVINVHKLAGKKVDEVLAMYYTIEMLRLLEGIHKAGIIHGDIKPDNFLIRCEEGRGEHTMGPWSHWTPEMTGGWQKRGLVLIDFGRSIDRRLYPKGTAFLSENHAEKFHCVEMQTQRPWAETIDTYGVCCIVHCLLHGQYMDVIQDPATQRWKPREKFKRYWNQSLWTEFFDTMLNVKDCLPASQVDLAEQRRKFESYLASNPVKSRAVKPALCRTQILLFEKRKDLEKK